MLKALENVEKQTAFAAIAEAILNITVQLEWPSRAEPISPLAAMIISEIRGHLSENGKATELDGLTQVREVLDDIADEILIGDRDRDSLIDRLGRKGFLPLSIFEKVESNEFKNSRESIGFARQCITKADSFVHFSEEPELNGKQWSIFLKKISGGGRYSDSYCLVHANRTGIKLEVQSLWHVFPDLVKIDEYTPLGILKSFVAHYGFPISVNGRPEFQKFIFNDRYIWNDDGELGIFVHRDRDSDHMVMPVLYKWSDNLMEICYAYAIDLDAYWSDFSARRVRRTFN